MAELASPIANLKDINMTELVSKNGNTYTLEYDAIRLYYWEGKGLPPELQGGYTGPVEAKHAFELWDGQKAKQKIDYTLTDLEQLDVYTKKSELLEFAEKVGITVTGTFIQASSLKKYIKEQLEARQ